MSRAKNEASVEDVGKALRANIRCLDEKLFCVVDLEVFASNYTKALVDVCAVSARATSKLLKQATEYAFDHVSAASAELFAQRAAACIRYCRTKVQGSTSGAKLSAAVKAIGCQLVGDKRDEKASLLGPLFRRSLQRRRSEETKLDSQTKSEPAASTPTKSKPAAESPLHFRRRGFDVRPSLESPPPKVRRLDTSVLQEQLEKAFSKKNTATLFWTWRPAQGQ